MHPRLSRAHWISSALVIGLPIATLAVISFLRQDLVRSALAGSAGKAALGAVLLGAGLGAAASLGGFWLLTRREGTAMRILRSLWFALPHLACTFPAMAAVLIAPILAVFLGGSMGGELDSPGRPMPPARELKLSTMEAADFAAEGQWELPVYSGPGAAP